MTYWDGNRWIPDEPAKPKPAGAGRRLLGASTEAALITLLLFGLIAGSALGARPAASSVWVNEVSAEARGTLRLHDAFTVGYSSREREPWALVTCFPADGTEYSTTYGDGSIWSAVFSVYPDGPSPQNFVLGDSVYPVWTGGAADCKVELVAYSRDLRRMSVLATAAFFAAP
jgi:hypothetical protein